MKVTTVSRLGKVDPWEDAEDLDNLIEDEYKRHNLIFGGVLDRHARTRRKLAWFVHTKDELIKASKDPERAAEIYETYELRYPDLEFRLGGFRRALIMTKLLPFDCPIRTVYPKPKEDEENNGGE